MANSQEQSVLSGEDDPIYPAAAPGLSDPGSAAAPLRSSCPHCGGAPSAGEYPSVYALGRVEPRFPKVGIEKEFAQVIGRRNAAGQTDRQAMRDALSKRENRYLARQLCWVFSIEGLETYLLFPRDTADLDLLIESIRPEPNPTDIDVVVGMRGRIAPPDLCNGLSIPIVMFDQIYSFDRGSLISSIPVPKNMETPQGKFHSIAASIFDRIMQMADNSGAAPEHIALNYLAVRYPPMYVLAAEKLAENATLSSFEVRPSPLNSARNILDVVFSFTNRSTDVMEKFFVRVDVTEKFPFIVTKLAPYFERLG